MTDTNVIITTALIPGRPAPVLITDAMVAATVAPADAKAPGKAQAAATTPPTKST